MIIDKDQLDILAEKAKASPRLRMNLDLRNTDADTSQRMLNAVEPGTVLPIHRHLDSNVTIVCIRGHFEELIYDGNGALIEAIDMKPGGNVINLPIGTWHSIRSLESGTVLLECMDGEYRPLTEEEKFQVKSEK